MRSVIKLLVTAFLAAVFAGPMTVATSATATTEQATAAFERFDQIVDVAFMEQYAVIPQRTDVVIVDSRPSRQYDKGHIPAAVHVPWTHFEQYAGLLPEDKGTLVVFYCGGLKCPLSHKSAFKAREMGYTNVKVFAEGYPAWIGAGNLGAVSTEYVKQLVDSGSAVIVDARPTARKYDKGHVPGALSIPWTHFDASLLPADKATPLVFYCGGLKCPLSVKSAMKAKELGYTDVRTYQAGMPAWVAAYPDAVETGAPVRRTAAMAGKEPGTITIESFEDLLAKGPGAMLVVDVRDPREFKAGTFKGAVNIPIDTLEKRVAELPTDRPVVFICNSGSLSGEAYDMVKLLRKDLHTFFLEAETTFRADGSYTIKSIAG